METEIEKKRYRRHCLLGALGAFLMLVGDLCLSVIPASPSDSGLFVREAYLNGSYELWRLPLLTRGLHLVGSMLRRRSNAEKRTLLTALRDNMWHFFEDGTLRPTVYRVLDIKEVEEAHAILERFENTGKVVLRVRQ